MGIARKLFLPPFFIVFSVKKEQTLEQKVFTADFHIKQTRSRIFLCHKIGFKLTGKPIPIYLESTQIILTKPKNKDSKDGRKTHNFCSRAPKIFFHPITVKKSKKNFLWSNRPWVYRQPRQTGRLYAFESSTIRKEIDFHYF